MKVKDFFNTPGISEIQIYGNSVKKENCCYEILDETENDVKAASYEKCAEKELYNIYDDCGILVVQCI